MKSLKEAVWRN